MSVPPLRLLDGGARWHGEPVPGERSAALLAVLAAAAPRAVAVEEIAEQVWLDQPPAHPDKAVQVLVSRARSRAVPEIVERTSGGYRLGLPAGDVDALVLRERVAEATAAHAAGDLDVARLAARDALEIPCATSGEGPVGELVSAALRDQARARRLLGSVLLARGEHAEALALLEAAMVAHPDDEDLLAEVIGAEAEVRGVATALAHYASYAEHVRERVGADPGPALRRLHTELLARDAPVRAGLRYDATPLIGRDDDVAALRAELHAHRVVSIVGPGGLGKTRMAHLLGRLSSEPVVHFVELVGVRSPEGVLAQVGSALGVLDAPSLRPGSMRGRAELDLRTRVIGALTAPTLLILDNCEHVVEAVADLVATLVAVTDTVRVLTTTRAPLGIAAERVYLLPQLPDAEAFELFVQRARAARPSTQLEPAEVESLVSRLDGLPLAVELAAAKTRVMSVSEISRRLADRFALLTHGDRSAPDRHRTLEAVIAWSWNLLRGDDQVALRTLAALPDGFSLDAAETLLGDAAVGRLAELVDQSLLVVQEGPDGLRYRFLETVREFGLKELASSGAAEQVRAAIREWAVDFSHRALATLFGPDQVRAVGEIAVETGNLVAVLRAALDEGDATVAVPVMALLSGFWTVRGDHFAMLAFTPRVLRAAVEAALPPEDERGPWRAVLASTIALLALFTGAVDPDAIARLDELGDSGETAPDAMRRVVLALVRESDPRAALAELGSTGDVDQRAYALILLGHLEENAGNLTGAREASSAALALCDPRRGPWARAQIQSQLCSLAAGDEDLETAARYAAQALPVIEAVRADEDAVQIRTVQVLADAVAGRLDRAEETFARIEATTSQFADNDLDTRLNVHMCRAELALARGDVARGLASYRDAGEEAYLVEERFRAKLVEGELPADFVSLTDDTAPWTNYALAVMVFAHVYHRQVEPVGAAAARLLAAPAAIGDELSRVDFPVTGAALVATGCWGVETGGDVETAARRVAMGRVFGYPRYQPVFSWAHVREVVARSASLDDLDTLTSQYAALDLPDRLKLARTL